jgi:hypothetical protein
MMGFLRALLVPVTTPFQIAHGLWERSCDWGWPIGVRIAVALFVFGSFVFCFVWAMFGFQWPLWE